MKNIKKVVFSLSMVVLLTACARGNNENKQSGNNSNKSSDAITLVTPKDTSMLTANCKAYIDDMRAQQEELEDDPYKYSDLNLYNGVHIEDSKYLDTGDPEGENRTRGKIPDRSDKSMGVDLEFVVQPGHGAEKYTVLVADNEEFNFAEELETTGNKVNVNNLFVNTTYYWKVVGNNEESEVGEFTTGDYPRWISARPLYNVRDNGGYMTYSGKRVKQGLVYRGGEITSTTNSGHYNTIANSSKEVFRDVMKIGVELDLRGASDIYDGYKACAFAEDGDIDYVQKAIKSYEQTFTQPTNAEARQMVRDIFEVFKTADEKPVYYHCFGGADRTGTVGFLLNGVLGVSYTDLVIDFELTSYSSIDNEHIRCHMPDNTSIGEKHQHSYDRWPALINQLKTDTTGGYAWDDDALLMDNIENFLVLACGVPEATINTIRDIMLED